MKEINQLIHLTSTLDIVKSIIVNGFYTSYTQESFSDRNILIPMISFANILFRDIGENEVINYGKYGIVLNREHAMEKFDLNPVFYVRTNSPIDLAFKNNFENSIIPQTLTIAKDVYSQSNCKNVTDYISFTPISKEVKNLLNTLDRNVNDNFLQSIKVIFEKYYITFLQQILLLKPYKIKDKKGNSKLAYNEREWRKSFLPLHFISEFTPNKELNAEYTKWIEKPKPHYIEKYILKVELTDIMKIYVDTDEEVVELDKFVRDRFGFHAIELNTLNHFKAQESN